MLGCWRLSPTLTISSSVNRPCRGFHCRAVSAQSHENGVENVVIVGSGWAGLSAAHHLSKQGFDVKVLDDGYGFGSSDDVCIQGFWYPYRNIFDLVDELGIKPFTNWMKSAQYSDEGLEVEFPVYQDLPQWPTPLGTLFYTQFNRLPLVDRLTSLALLAAVIDFDNTDLAWRKYDSITARELFKQFGCSESLYQNVINPLLQVGLFAPAEQCSAAATLGLLYYYIFAHQKNFDLVWCKGTLKEKIFEPWMDEMRSRGCEFLDKGRVTDIVVNEETDHVSEVVCGDQKYTADAVIFAVGISTLQQLVKNSAALSAREDFAKVLYLSSIDVISVKLWFDRKVNIPNAANACSGFGYSFAWTFFNLNQIYDEYKDSQATVLQADFYNANELLALNDELVLAKVMSCLSKCIEDFSSTAVNDKQILRFPNLLPHYFPGSYKHMMLGSTSFPNLFMAGNWITTRHGSWSQEKAYVTGLEAANRVMNYLEDGSFAKIIPVEEDEPHIEALRNVNRRFNEVIELIPLSSYFLQ